MLVVYRVISEKSSIYFLICRGDEMERAITVGEIITKAKVEKCGNNVYPVLSMTMHAGC